MLVKIGRTKEILLYGSWSGELRNIYRVVDEAIIGKREENRIGKLRRNSMLGRLRLGTVRIQYAVDGVHFGGVVVSPVPQMVF
ncbi:unnamed protein product [Dovyalis caffra]|uniref:Uncharacterized protein n=1 Tax=Dovyalis caffra TaxID=77055 RepID=A0AAV1S8J8_9ROSI|nr:unnamed protein product [Dovyalis caffra]